MPIPDRKLPANAPLAVTVENFIRAESDFYFAPLAKERGAFGKLLHVRELTPLDQQGTIRNNRDTLYSAGIFDLDAGPLTVTLPDSGKRFMSLQIISQDHYTWPAVYAPSSRKITREEIGTRYVMIGIRTLLDPADKSDQEKAAALQDAINIDQPAGPGTYEVPTWDPASQKKVRDALLVLATTIVDTSKAFGTKSQVDPVQRLIGAASAWGANPPQDATYLNFVPEKNDGKTIYRLVVKDVPVDGFWSVSVYNAEGYFEKNVQELYTLNNMTAKKADDGSVTIQFGGWDGKTPNVLPIMPGWNYMVRLYRPRPEILDGSWKFPVAQAVW